jgi:hypothetical protein
MNTASYQSRLLLICSLWGIVCFSAGCRQPALNGHEQHNASYKYGILINAKKGERTNDRIVWINSLDTGHIDPEKNVTDLSQKLGTHVIMGNGFLLSFNKTTHQLSKYKLNGQELILNDSIKLKQFDYLSSSINLDSNKLYLSGHSTENADSYTIIDTRYMRLLKSASLKLPVAPKQILSQNFAVRIADKLYIGYSSFDEKYEFSSDTSYLAIFSYQSYPIKYC